MSNWIKKKKLKDELLRENGSICRYCGRKINISDIQIKHVIPEKQNGKTDINNCALSCSSCNSSKYNMSLSEWLTHSIKKREEAKLEYTYRRNIVKNIKELLEEGK